jgi:hypothetical protein
MLVMGIDPGKHTGIAICDGGYLANLYETDFWGAIDSIGCFPDAVVVIELPDTKHVWHDGARTKASIQRTGVNVGSALREAELLIQYLVRIERQHIVQKPHGKMTADQFKRLTGWNGRTNQHMRDAAMLVFGLKLRAK